jgi:Rha family phage regulatory protein
MNSLVKILNRDGQLVVTSRQVAEDFEKNHRDVLKAIDGLITEIGVAKNCAGLFIPTKYQHEQNKQWYREYLLTRDGFSLLVMGFTGPTALQWKLKYIEAFNKMEQYIKEKQKPTCIEDILIQSLEQMKNLRLQVEQAKQALTENKQEIQDMRDVITLSPNAWRTKTTQLINKIAIKLGGFEHIRLVREESYKLLEERGKTRLGIRLSNMRKNVLIETGSRSKANKISKLDVIAADKRLAEIYVAIVKEMAIKYKVA